MPSAIVRKLNVFIHEYQLYFVSSETYLMYLVGNSSAAKIQITAKAAETPNFPANINHLAISTAVDPPTKFRRIIPRMQATPPKTSGPAEQVTDQNFQSMSKYGRPA